MTHISTGKKLELLLNNMKKEIQKDIFGVEPEIGDLIVYNPPKYKGLIVAKCVGFASSGLPELEIDKVKNWFYTGQPNSNGYYTPKTGFVVHKVI